VAAATALMFFGWRLYRVGLILAGAVGGGMGAMWLADKVQLPVTRETAVMVCGVLGALAAWPLEKLAVSVVGGSAGAALVAMQIRQIGGDDLRPEVLPVAAVLSFGLCAWAALSLRKFAVIFATSAWGAMLLVLVPLAVYQGATQVPWDGAKQSAEAVAEDLRTSGIDRYRTGINFLWLALTGLGILAQYGVRAEVKKK